MRRSFFLVAVSAVLSVGCGSGEPTPPFRPMADVQQLMVSIVDPAADILWGAVGTVISEEGIDEWSPRTDEEWAAVQNAAVVVMEAGNLLMIGDRARDNLAWMRMADNLVDAGALALEAAESKNPDALLDVGADVYYACDRCHNLYWIGDEERRPLSRSRLPVGLVESAQ